MYSINDRSTYISNSQKRFAILCEYQKLFGIESRKILKLSDTRWLVLKKYVTRLLDNWDVLKHYFRLEVFQNKTKVAQDIYNISNNDKIEAYMFFLKYVLNYFNKFNVLF